MKSALVSLAVAVAILAEVSNAKLSTARRGLRASSDEQERAANLESDAGFPWDSSISTSLSMKSDESFMTVGVTSTADTANGISRSKNGKSGKSSKGNTQCGQFVGGIQADKGFFGNMFKIKATQDIVISGFSYYSQGYFWGEDDVTIWEKCGDYEGFENDSTVWNKIQDVVGIKTMGCLPKLETPIFVAKDSYRSFHILSAGGVWYTNGRNEGDIYSQDSSITLYEGKGCGGEFDCTSSPRVWNGFIDYCVVPPSKSGKSSGFENTCPPVTPSPTGSPSMTVAPSVSVAPSPSPTTNYPTWSPTTTNFPTFPWKNADNGFSNGEKEFPSHLMDDGSLDSSHDGSVDSSLAMDQPH